MNDGALAVPGLFLRRFSAIELLIAVVALFVTVPFVESLKSGPLIESILFTIVLISAILAIAASRRTLIIATTFAVPTLAGRWIHYYRPDLLPPEVFLIGGIIFTAFIIANLLRFVLTASSVTTEVLCGAIAAYLLLALLWAFGYWLIAELVPDSFAFNASIKGEMSIKGFDGLYFSTITLCTVGYGDISPVSKVARMLAAMEAITGPLYLAVLIARLVTLRSAPKAL